MLSLNAKYVFSNTSDANGIFTPLCYFSFDPVMLLMCLIILACELIFPWRYDHFQGVMQMWKKQRPDY